jgi:ABC-2 type transport system ATP-binding protein
MNDLAIETHHLRKIYGGKVAVQGLTLEVRRGEVVGFLGPNGAGKTTSMKMLLGLVAPTGGEALLLGQPLGDIEARRKIGFLPEHFRFHDWLTATEFLRLHGRLYRISPARLSERIPALLDLVGLIPHREKRLRDFSKGMLQRIGLAQTLLNDPELIFLDEPTSGLDPVGRRLVRDLIREQRRRGATVFLNSHLLSEIEITCDRVAFIKHGEVLEMRELRALAESEIAVSVRALNLSPEIMAGLEQWAHAVRLDGEQLTFNVAGETVLPEITRYLVTRGVNVYAVTSQQRSLEELFIQIVGTDGGL